MTRDPAQPETPDHPTRAKPAPWERRAPARPHQSFYLNAAIDTTSPNTNGVDTLDTPFADPDLETMRQKLNEMILNGRR